MQNLIKLYNDFYSCNFNLYYDNKYIQNQITKKGKQIHFLISDFYDVIIYNSLSDNMMLIQK